MNLNFSQHTGWITKDDGSVITKLAFAGNDSRPDTNPNHIQGRNNPAMQDKHSIGPLPQGLYRVGIWGRYPKVGGDAAPLTWIGGVDNFGRSDFFIHGPGDDYWNSSEGCIIVPHDDRIKIEALKPTTITVVA